MYIIKEFRLSPCFDIFIIVLFSLSINNLKKNIMKANVEKKLDEMNSEHVWTPLPIVYKHGDTIEILDYLDLDRRGDVWGIQMGDNTLAKKTVEYGALKFEKALKVARQQGCRIPNYEDILNLQDGYLKFELACEILRKNAISADSLFIGYHLSSKEIDDQFFCYYGFNPDVCEFENVSHKQDPKGKTLRCILEV